MELKRKKTKNRKRIALVIIIIVLILGGGYWAWMEFSEGTNDTDSSEQNNKEENDPDDKKNAEDKADNGATTDQPTIESDKPAPQNDVPVVSENNLNVSAYASVEGGTLTIGNILIYPVLQSGTCTLMIGNYTTSSDINPAHNGPSYSVCDDFNIPTGNFSGNNFTLKVTSEEKLGSMSGSF